MIRKYTTETFIERAREIHGDKYEYSKVVYDGMKGKVIITCPKHGDFEQKANNHINLGHGCPKCKLEKLSEKFSYTNEEYIQKASEKHNGFYDYTKTNYVNGEIKITITCPIHGDFEQQAQAHLRGQGCPKCGAEKRGISKRLCKDEFIERAKHRHGDKYDYSKVEYNTYESKVTIICPIHGEFKQTPDNHIHGKGCPHCNASKLEEELKEYFNEKNVDFCFQHKFEWLGKLKLDFYLPQYNVVIECQGIQHFQPIKHFRGEEGFNIIKERDKRKRELCKENDVKVLYYSNLNINYPYNVYENKDELLKEIIK